MSVRSLNIEIPGPPQGQGRVRVLTSKAGQPVHFTDSRTRSYAQQIQGEWIAEGRPTLPDGPYRLTVAAHHVRPDSHRLRDGSLSAAGRRAPYPGKPDLDNVVKGILDALVACGAIPDDRHMVSVDALKLWTRERCPCVRVSAVSYADEEIVGEAA